MKYISSGKKACIYLFSMGIIGAVIGSIDNKLALNQCLNSEECLVDDAAERKVYRMGVGAVAGMVAASMLSLPAILNEK